MDTPPSSSKQNLPVESADPSGVNISGQANVTAHDIIGRDQYIGYTADQVNVLLTRIQTEYRPKPFDRRSPYVGLASFQERDADKFFGRETLTAELVTRVATSAASNARALFVAGPSGSGKSSLVRAGLIPALRRGATLWSPALGSEHWLYETCKPGRAPLDELARVVSSFANSPDAGDDFRAHALNDATRLHRWADIALNDDASRRAVLVIDQFEEIFTQLAPEREAERVAFLNLLTRAATVENGRVLVIFTLRSDFVSNCASYPELNALVNQQFHQVGAMTPDELVSAIARPAYQVGLRLDPALISQIVNDVRGEPGALPLMQFALQDLFQAEKHKGELTLDGYTVRGGLHEALERHADAEFAKLDDAEKQLARTVFSGLVEIGRGRADTKRTARFGELVPAGADAARVQVLVRELADARLITTDEQDGKETVTLAHERLIDAWDWLRKLVDENRDAIALQNEIAQDAQEWETQKRDESYLYRGARLATAQEKLQQNKLVLNGLAQEFVETALAARERELAEREATRQRELEQAQALAAEQKQRAEEQAVANKRLQRRNLFLGAAFLLALLAVGAALFFLTQSNANLQRAEEQAKISASRALAAQSVSKRNENLPLAYLLGIEAFEKSDTFEALSNLATLRFQDPYQKSFLWGLKTFGPSVFSPDGKLLASWGCEEVGNDRLCTRGGVFLWDVELKKPIGKLSGHTNSVLSVAFSPDGKTLASGSCKTRESSKVCKEGELFLWDIATQRRIGELQGQTSAVQDIAYSSDRRTLASWGCEQRDADSTCMGHEIFLWDTEKQAHIGTLEMSADFVYKTLC